MSNGERRPTEGVVNISEYSTALRRFWPAILALGLAGAILGGLLLSVRGGDYIAEARVEVRPLVTAGDNPNLDTQRLVNSTNEQAIGASQRVTEQALRLLAAAESLGTTDLDDPLVVAAASDIDIDEAQVRSAQEQIEVTIPFESQILVFTASSGTPERARDLAQSVAHAYLDFRQESGEASTTLSREKLQAREAELISEIEELVDGRNLEGDQVSQLPYQAVAKSQELQGIGAKLANLNAISIDPGKILDDAELPDATAGLGTPVGVVGGLLAGLLGGVAAAYWLDRRDDRFRDVNAELSSLGVRAFGEVPIEGGLFRKDGPSSIVAVNSQPGEAYRRVQGSMLFNLDQTDKSVVLIAGTNNPQSATTVAANLAAAAARAGRRTLLVGADLRRPSLHERFDLPNDVGLSDVLSGRAHFAGSLQAVPDIANLRLLSSGSPVDQPARLLQGQGLGRLVSAARDEFDLVIFEAPPVLQVADAVDLARLCEGSLLVVEPERATRRGVAESIEQLRRVGSEVVGTVVAESAPA